jgi:hypothetical protein
VTREEVVSDNIDFFVPLSTYQEDAFKMGLPLKNNQNRKLPNDYK